MKKVAIGGNVLPPEVRPGQSVELLQALHILTRDGKLNQDSRRKLKQVYHLFQFIEPLLLALPEAVLRAEPETSLLWVALAEELGVLLLVTERVLDTLVVLDLEAEEELETVLLQAALGVL